MTVAVLGANGMLGRYMSKVLSTEHDVQSVTRDNIDLTKFEEYPNFMKYLSENKIDCIVNCAGSIKPAVDKQNTHKTFMCNTVFPQYLGHISQYMDIPVVHITTDCVFSGKTGNYSEFHKSDVFDAYGLSKRLGESRYICNIRTSIIGEEVENKYSLIEWAKSNKGKEVNGYTNHTWNGLTCLELSKYILYLINNNAIMNGIEHIHSEVVTKYELLQLISDAFNLDLKITPVEAETACYRTMVSEHYSIVSEPPPLSTQLFELAQYHEVLFSG